MTASQCKAYKVPGKTVRMDSKLISSNIAWHSRYEIIHSTLLKSVDKSIASHITDQQVRLKAEDFLGEDAAKTVYSTDSETLGKRLLDLGIVISHILKVHKDTEQALLRRVFHEQYDVAEDGTVTLRDKKLITSDSVQNPNDTDAAYRSKNGKKIKGFVANITETCDEESKRNLITDVQVEPANKADNGFVKDAVNKTKEVTGNKVDKVHADGACQSMENRELAADKENGFDFIANGIQGRPSCFDLDLQEDGALHVTDRQTAEVMTATR